MDEKPLVSIIIILDDFFHLANLTIESIIHQKEKPYEIIVIETAHSKKDLVMLKPYIDKIYKIYHSFDDNITHIMNQAIDKSNGQYLHFMFSGDTYVSRYAFGYLKSLIEEKKSPDLICSAFLRRDALSPPESVNFSFEYFSKGKIPMHIQSCWFNKETLRQLHGFDLCFKYQSGFDMICKIFLKKEKKVIFSNRVLTDYEYKKKPSKVFMRRAWENIKIIYRHFGFVKTVAWWVIHDHFRMFKLFMLNVKRAFWNP